MLLLVLCHAPLVADDRPFFPQLDGDTTVFVQPGVADDFQVAREAIKAVSAKNSRRYRGVIIKTDGKTGGAPAMLRQLVDRWWEPRDRRLFAPDADITIVLDLGDRSIAVDIAPSLLDAAGLDMRAIEREIITKTFVPKAKDMQYAAGLAGLVSAIDQAITGGIADVARRAENARIFRTQTLPMAAAGMAIAGVAAALAVLRWRHASYFAKACAALAAFKHDVVALSDLLDSAQERHRMLPHADPDFRTPMRGMTRDAFDAVQSAIGRYREQWLSLMETWEKAEERLKQEWFLGTAASRDVIGIFESSGARPPLNEVKAVCHGPLDALESGHERARELSVRLHDELALARDRLDGLAGRGRSAAQFERTIAEATRGAELVDEEIEPDPVAARGRIEATRESLTHLLATVDALEAADDRRLQVIRRADDLQARVAARRAEGWLLTEPGADPTALLAKAFAEVDLAARLLDSGDVPNAGRHLNLADESVSGAARLLESIAAARNRTDESMPTVAAALTEVADAKRSAEHDRIQLDEHYAHSAWSDVADNITKAEQGLAHARQLLDDARAALAKDRQHYFHAVAALEEANRQTLWSRSLLAAISGRREELDHLAAAMPSRLKACLADTSALAETLARQRTDRARAHERCREAERLLALASAAGQAAKPDPREITRWLEAALTAVARGQDLAAEDERLSRQARADLDEADATIRRVSAWYSEAVRVDIQGAKVARDLAERLFVQLRYEDAIRAAADASQQARAAYAAANAEAERRRRHREAEQRERQMQDAFRRTRVGDDPLVITLPTGPFAGPDPVRSIDSSSHSPTGTVGRESSNDGWSRDIATGRW